MAAPAGFVMKDARTCSGPVPSAWVERATTCGFPGLLRDVCEDSGREARALIEERHLRPSAAIRAGEQELHGVGRETGGLQIVPALALRHGARHVGHTLGALTNRDCRYDRIGRGIDRRNGVGILQPDIHPGSVTGWP